MGSYVCGAPGINLHEAKVVLRCVCNKADWILLLRGFKVYDGRIQFRIIVVLNESLKFPRTIKIPQFLHSHPFISESSPMCPTYSSIPIAPYVALP